MRQLLLALIALSFVRQLHAHGDLHERIDALTSAITADSNNGGLYLQRAELHRAHEDFPAALRDYGLAEALLPGQSAIDYGRGLALAALRRNSEAIASLTKCIVREPRHYEAFGARARVFARELEIDRSVADYDRAIEMSPALQPDFVLERARVLEQTVPPQLDRAATGLREVLTRRGDVVPIALELCDIEAQRGEFDAALAIIDRLREKSRRQENWLMKRGELLAKAGRVQEAEKTFRDALAALESLAPHLRGTPATLELETTLRTRIADAGSQKAKAGN